MSSLSRVTLLILLVATLVALAGCRSQPLITPSQIPSPLGAEQNRQAILRGLAQHRWLLVSEEPGLITAEQNKGSGKHIATVDIAYDDETIDIAYRSSHGLRCEPQGDSCASIHRAYNRWVVQLAKDIRYGIHLVQFEATAAQPVGAGRD